MHQIVAQGWPTHQRQGERGGGGVGGIDDGACMRGVWGHSYFPRKTVNIRCSERSYMYPNTLVRLECMAGVIPPFATIHVSRHEAFQSTIVDLVLVRADEVGIL